jgi:hypothetical protein
MKITEIIVGAGRTFNHPYEQFSNLRPQVTIKAILDDGDDPEEVIKDLQAKAESMVEDHKNNILQSLRELHTLSLRQREMASLEKQLREAQARLDEIRKEYPQITAEEVI